MKIRINLYYGVLIAAAYFALNLLLNSLWKFHQLHNDYWDLLFIAKNIDFRNPYSLVNPCIPIGYTSLLHLLIQTGSEITVPIIVNLIFSTLTLYFSLQFYNKITENKRSILSAVLLGFFPPFFFYANQGGADPGSVLFFTAGALALLDQFFIKNSANPFMCLLSGIYMGIGSIFRFHVLVGSILFIVMLIPFNKRMWKMAGIAIIGVLLFYSPQIFLNLATHHGPLETKLGSTNIFNLMYGINWYKTSTDQIPTATLKIISSDYQLFLKKYLFSFFKFFIKTGLIPLFLSVISKRYLIKKLAGFVTIFLFVYFGLFSATASGRQILLALPLTMLCFGLLVEELILVSKLQTQPKRRIIQFSLVTITSTIAFIFAVFDIKQIQRNISEFHLSQNVESFLIDSGCQTTEDIFTTDFDLYFRKLPGYTGYFNGGWSRWGTYKFNETYPEFDVSSVDNFIFDCKKRHLRFLVLTKKSEQLCHEAGDIYTFQLKRSDIRFLKEFETIRIFEIL